MQDWRKYMFQVEVSDVSERESKGIVVIWFKRKWLFVDKMCCECVSEDSKQEILTPDCKNSNAK